jgi:hypothetical protein
MIIFFQLTDIIMVKQRLRVKSYEIEFQANVRLQ